MLNEKQIERMLGKLAKFEEKLGTMLFDKVDELPMLRTEECGPLDAPPADDAFRPFADGETWGGEGKYCWLKGCYTVPQELDGKTLFLAPKSTFYEAMLWVDGQPFGTFCNKIVIGSHGNHYCDMIAQNVHAGQTIDIAMEMYTWHYLSGNDPWKMEEHGDFRFKLGPADICVKNELINEFYFDLKTVNQMVECLDKDSFRRADLIRTLLEVHKTVYYSVEDIDRETFLAKLAEADTLLNAQLAKKNSETTPFAGLIGHSHMDTAWLWHKGETLKKCARTYANELNLMAQYPEYTFIQSSAYHGDMIRRHYPQLFARIQQAVAAGRYEPNGGVWIECDCNITSGESMIRQFLWGQRFTRKYFGYTSNCFWLPDTFGYSASIPQIMKGCVDEYSECSVDEIAEKYIEGTPEVGTVGVHVDDTNRPPKAPEIITGSNNEDSTLTEGTVRYDVRFDAIAPATANDAAQQDVIRLIINVEAQTAFNPGYPLTKRAIYYCSRMISAQHGPIFKKSEYGKIRKVYSIWVCTKPSDEFQNTLTRYSIRPEQLIGNATEKSENYDLMSVVTICLGKPDAENYTGILKFLDVLLSSSRAATEKKKILEEEFGVAMSEELEREVLIMCNLSQGVKAEGREEGIGIGREEGIGIGEMRMLIKQVRKGRVTVEEAAEDAEMTVEEFKKVMENTPLQAV